MHWDLSCSGASAGGHYPNWRWKGGPGGNNGGSWPPTRLPSTLSPRCCTWTPTPKVSCWCTQPFLTARKKQPPGIRQSASVCRMKGREKLEMVQGFPTENLLHLCKSCLALFCPIDQIWSNQGHPFGWDKLRGWSAPLSSGRTMDKNQQAPRAVTPLF